MKKNLYYIILLFLLSLSCVSAQDHVESYEFRSIKEGFSKVGIYKIDQDDLGFIWFGTNGGGLYRYDGTSYHSYNYQIGNPTSLSSSLVFSTYVDQKNRMWIGTDDGLNLYDRDNDRFIRIPNDNFKLPEFSNIAIKSLLNYNDEYLLIGTIEHGLYQMRIEDFSIKKISNQKELTSLTINDIKITKSGVILAATNQGVKIFDTVTGTLKTAFSLLKDQSLEANISIESLSIDADDTVWAGSAGYGLFKIKSSNTGYFEEVEHFKFTNKRILSLLSLKDGSLMCGTENDGLFHIDKEGSVLNSYSTDRSGNNRIASNSIWSLFMDKNQRIWMGYYNRGIAVYDKSYDKFFQIEKLDQNKNSLTHSSVTGISQDKTGRLWIATDGGGINVHDKEFNRFSHITSTDNSMIRGLSSDNIESIFIDSKQNVWAGSWDKGIFILENGSNIFQNFTKENTSNNLSSNSILTITEDENGVIWIGTFSSGLNSYNPLNKKFTNYSYGAFKDLKLHNAGIRKVIADKENNIWIASSIGLFKLEQQEDKKLKIISFKDQMPKSLISHNSSDNILSLFESNDGYIWLGTRGAGLSKYDPESQTFTWYNSAYDLEEKNVNAITESLDGSIWITGNSGITELNLDKNLFISYNSNDGLLSNDYNINASHRDKDGTLYFGNFLGIDYFNPSDLKINLNLPSLYLSDFKLFNESIFPDTKGSPLKKVIARTDSITLTSKQSVFTVEYSSINFTRSEKNEYAYFLENYESSYNYVGKKRSATYTNLDPGDYVFNLKAANNDGVWNDKPLRLYITILPAWWATSWAIAAYLLMFVLLTWILVKIIRTRINDKQLVLTERNNRLLEKELNEKKIQFFTNISHEFRTPLSLIIGPIEDILNNEIVDLPERIKQKQHTIYKNAIRLRRLINELLDFRKLDLNKAKVKAKKLNLVHFTSNIMSHFKEEAFMKNIHLSLDADIQDMKVWADESMLEKIIFNILSNAFKVTPEGGAVTVDLSSNEKKLRLPLANAHKKIKGIEIKISDTGPGLEQEQINRIFERFYQVEHLNKMYYGGTGIGLEVVQNFVKLHKGEIKIKSELGKGVVFKVVLPAGKKHFTDDELTVNIPVPSEEKKKFVFTIDHEKELSESSSIKTPSRTLLIVEDNAELRNYLKSELKSQYKILLARNGKEGLQAAKEYLPDVIITDVIMPEMDGFQFCKQIKSDIKTSHIPLLMLTAKTTVENRMEGIENGADAYMVKPFNMGLLKLRVSQLVTSRQLIFNKYFSVISDADKDNTTSLDKEFLEKVLNFINKSLSDPDLNVESLSAQLNLSRSQFYRKIKALTNQTANEFIRNIRLLKAKQIIEAGNSNISEVCYMVGFSSPSYFSKCFKSYFGILPKDVNNSKS